MHNIHISIKFTEKNSIQGKFIFHLYKNTIIIKRNREIYIVFFYSINFN